MCTERLLLLLLFVLLKGLVMAETDRAIYERQRRKKLAEERRRYQILFPWLHNTFPEIFSQFNVFFESLSERNPRTKNLSITQDFKCFLRQGKGMYYVFVLSHVIVVVVVVIKCVCCVFLDFMCEGNKDVPNTSYDPITEAMEFAINFTKDSVTGSDISSDCVKDSDHTMVSDGITDPIENETENGVENEGMGDSDSESMGESMTEGCDNTEEDSDSGTIGEPNFERAVENVPERENVVEEGSDYDSGTEDMLNTPAGIPETPEPELDTFAALEEAIEDFDYSVEIFDWENFQEDLDTVENMDFCQFLV